MSHPDDDALVAFAMGDDSAADIAAHLAHCRACRTAVLSTVTVMRATERLATEPVVLEEPPPGVWSAIRSELDGETARPITVAVRPAGSHSRREPRDARRRVGMLAALVGVAAALLVVVLGVRQLGGRSPSSGQSEPIASGRLVALPGQSASGSAQLFDHDGHRTLLVRLNDAGVGSKTYVEAWLFEPGTSRMVSLGVMTQRQQTFAVPEGLDLATYSSVDLSAEPFDGNPAHSKDSLAQGRLAS